MKTNDLLVVVHPDAMEEIAFTPVDGGHPGHRGKDAMDEYGKLLTHHLPLFDHSVSFLMYPDGLYPTHSKWRAGVSPEFYNSFQGLMNKVRAASSEVISRDEVKEGLRGIAEYVIDYKPEKILFAGGYEPLCVQDHIRWLRDRYDWLLSETGTKILPYRPLLFSRERDKDINVSWDNVV